MRRFLRVLKFGALGVFGLLGAGLIGLAVANAPLNAELAEKIEKLRAAGEPVSIADLGADAPRAKDNAAAYLDRAAQDCLAIQQAVAKTWDREAAERKKAGAESDDSFDDSPVMLDAYRAALATHPKAVDLLVKASQCPRFHLNVDYRNEKPTAFIEELLQKFRGQRAAIRVLDYRVRLLLAEGKTDEALDTCLALLRLADLYAQGPALVGQLVAIACRSEALDASNRVLHAQGLSPAARDRLEETLAGLRIRESFRDALRSERAVGIDHFNDPRLMMAYTGLPSGKRGQMNYLELIEHLIATADRPLDDQEARAQRQAILDRADVLTHALVPAIEATERAVTRNEAQTRCLRVLVALHGRDTDAGLETPLAELGLPAQVTIDPFSGQPLHAKRTAAGWVVYSVGKNLQDDGGRLDDEATDVGFGPPGAND